MTVVTAMLVLAAQQPPQQVTLAEAVRRALEVQPAVIQARGDVRNASAGERAAWGAFLPTITTASSAARSNVGRIDQVTGRAVPPSTPTPSASARASTSSTASGARRTSGPQPPRRTPRTRGS